MADGTPSNRSKALSMGKVFERLEKRIGAREGKNPENLDESEERLLNQHIQTLTLVGPSVGLILNRIDLPNAEHYLDILYHLGSYKSPALLLLFVTTFEVTETLDIEWDGNVFDGKWQKVKISSSLVQTLERKAEKHNIVDKLKENKWEKEIDRTHEEQPEPKKTVSEDSGQKKRGLKERLGFTQEGK